MMTTPTSLLPVTLLSGFVGAGKRTQTEEYGEDENLLAHRNAQQLEAKRVLHLKNIFRSKGYF
jgi:hypothetical protein